MTNFRNAMMAAAHTASGPSVVSVANSALFDDANSEYLSRTPSSAGNRDTWTISYWVYKTYISGARAFFTAGSNNTNVTELRDDQGVFEYRHQDGGSITDSIITTAVFRDIGWYHIVWAVDTTQAVESSRVILYVNGERITDFSTANYPAQNADTDVNATVPTNIGARTGPDQYWSGYMAEAVLIDGLQLTPTSFAGFDSTGTYWTPLSSAKIKELTFGTNGFYLDNTTNAQTDASGNGNNFTNNNTVLTVSGHTPTNISCLLNPLWKNTSSVLSNGNRTVDEGATGWQFVMATLGVSSGKWYWEVKAESLSDGEAMMTGIANDTINAQGTNSTGTGFYGYSSYGVTYSTSSASYGDTYGDDDIIGVQLNMDDGEIHFYKNNTIQNSGTAAFTGLTGVYYPMTAVYNLYHPVHRFAEDEWTYTAPTGYKALNTTNIAETVTLPTDNFDDYFETVLYTGTGSEIDLDTTNGFAPDFVWLKDRSAAHAHWWTDSVRGATKSIFSSGNSAEQTQAQLVKSFDSDGVTLGTYSQINTSSNNYVSWNFKAGGAPTATNSGGASPTSGSVMVDGSAYAGSLSGTIHVKELSVNTEIGFACGVYDATGSAGTIDTLLGSAPDVVIVKALRVGASWMVFHSSNGVGKQLLLNSTNGSSTDAQGFTSSNANGTFGVGTGAAGNTNQTNGTSPSHVFYAWKKSPYIAIGSYEGTANASTAPFVPTIGSTGIPIQPKFILQKNVDGSFHWQIYDKVRSPNNVIDEGLYANSSVAEQSGNSNNTLDIGTGFFKPRGTGDPNRSNTSVYLALGKPIIDADGRILTPNPPPPKLFIGDTVAIGGVVTLDGDYRIHTFTSSGTFTVIKAASGVTLDYLVIAGAGSGGAGGTNASGGGGGGAGGYRASWNNEASGGGGSSETGLTAAIQDYTVTIGGGGAATSGANNGISGSNSVFGSITAVGGGFGAREGGGSGGTGGSGGGVGQNTTVGAGTSNQGFNGGAKTGGSGGSGGGGAGSVGANCTSNNGGAGGSGVASTITGSSVSRAGGGGGGSYLATGGSGSSGAGRGGNSNETGVSGTANTGGGGGGRGGQNSGTGGVGGSGIVIIRYKYK